MREPHERYRVLTIYVSQASVEFDVCDTGHLRRSMVCGSRRSLLNDDEEQCCELPSW